MSFLLLLSSEHHPSRVGQVERETTKTRDSRPYSSDASHLGLSLSFSFSGLILYFIHFRASQKLNLASPHRRKRHGSSDGDGSPASSVTGSPAHRQHQRHHFATDFCALLRRNPPPPPARLLHRLGTREKAGVGKVYNAVLLLLLLLMPPGLYIAR